VRGQSEAATALWIIDYEIPRANPKRRSRFALPPHSK